MTFESMYNKINQALIVTTSDKVNAVSSENRPSECTEAIKARKEVDIETELKGDISVEAFRENAYKSNPLVLSGAALDAAVYCSPGDTSIPLNHPICKAIIEFAQQLKAECKTRVCDSDKLFKRLQIKE